MRITGGMFGGRRLQGADGPDVRPTQDRVREAVFSALAARIPDCAFLDLYAGTGAVGLEAWSRGAGRVCWVEASPRVFRGLKAQIRTLSGDGRGGTLEPMCMDVRSFCRRTSARAPFDIVYADPPYRKEDTRALLGWIGTNGLLQQDGLVILEQAADEPVPAADGWALVRDKRYGGSRLRMFRTEEKQ